MSRLDQLLHVLGKDLRAHVIEIAGLALLNLLLVFADAETWARLVAGLGADSNGLLPTREDFGILVGLVLVAGWWIVIARIVQAELPASRKQFWLTRPIDRSALLGAKLAAILLVVHGATLIAHALILVIAGLPFEWSALVANQLVIAALVSLPAAAIAALTPDLGRYLLVSVLIVGIAIVFIQFSGVTGSARYLNFAGQIDGDPYRYGNGLRLLFLLVALAAIALAGLVRQYRSRRSLAVAGACGAGLVLTMAIAFAFPRGLVSAVNTRLIGRADPAPVLVFPGPTAEALSMRSRGFANNYYAPPAWLGGGPAVWDDVVEIPVEVAGGAVGRFDLANAQVRLRAADGAEAELAAGIWAYQAADGSSFGLRFRLPPDFQGRIADEAVTVRAAVDVVEYLRTGIGTVPPDGSAVLVEPLQQCGVAWRSIAVCRRAFRSATRVVLFSDPEQGSQLEIRTRPGLSVAFVLHPTGLQTYAVWPFSMPEILRRNNEPLAEPLPVFRHAPVGYTRVTLEIDAVRLADWSLAR